MIKNYNYQNKKWVKDKEKSLSKSIIRNAKTQKRKQKRTKKHI